MLKSMQTGNFLSLSVVCWAITLATSCPSFADDVASAVDLINSRLRNVQLVKVPLPTIAHRQTIATYEMKRKQDEDRPLAEFRDKKYEYSYNLHNRYQINLDDFCDSLSYARMRSDGLYYIDIINKRLDSKLKDDWAILLKEALGEGLLAAYTFVTYMQDARYNADISLLGSTVDGAHTWQEKLTQRYTFPVLPKTSRTFEYAEPKIIFNADKTYSNHQVPNLRANSVQTNLIEPVFSNCKYQYRNMNILDGIAISKSDSWAHTVRIYIHVYQ